MQTRPSTGDLTRYTAKCCNDVLIVAFEFPLTVEGTYMWSVIVLSKERLQTHTCGPVLETGAELQTHKWTCGVDQL